MDHHIVSAYIVLYFVLESQRGVCTCTDSDCGISVPDYMKVQRCYHHRGNPMPAQYVKCRASGVAFLENLIGQVARLFCPTGTLPTYSKWLMDTDNEDNKKKSPHNDLHMHVHVYFRCITHEYRGHVKSTRLEYVVTYMYLLEYMYIHVLCTALYMYVSSINYCVQSEGAGFITDFVERVVPFISRLEELQLGGGRQCLLDYMTSVAKV